MLRTKLTVVMMGAMMLCAAAAYAEYDGHAKHAGKEGPHKCPIMTKVLNLSEDQQKQLENLWTKKQESKKIIIEQVKSNRQAFDAEITKASPDMGKISTLQTELKTIESQVVDERLNSLLEVKKVMTPEQFTGFLALKKAMKMKGMMQARHKMGGMCSKCAIHKDGKDDYDENKD